MFIRKEALKKLRKRHSMYVGGFMKMQMSVGFN